MTTLHDLLDSFRATAATEREKGTYFERLVRAFLVNEPYYADLYGGRVWMWEDWRAQAAKRGLGDVGADAGIDLVAETGTGELHAIQAKFYDADARLTLRDLSTFLTAAGRKAYSHSLIFLTATKSTGHLREGLKDQKTPVSIVTLHDLEASQIDWSQYRSDVAPVLKPCKQLRPHQESALKAVTAGFQTAERGKLIMACGSGKTFAALKIAEAMAGAGKRVLFLVPSLSLLSQTLTEWTQESATPLHSFAVCSDSTIGKKKIDGDFEMLTHELQYPATTEAGHLADETSKRHDATHMSAVFATYHSIEVIHQAQQRGMPGFDLVICDEAHRSTGATFEGEDESHFVKVHDADYLAASKRLYMTATPRVYGEDAKAKADSGTVTLASMDDPATFGHTFYTLTFSEAVKRDLLVDYKVIVLSVEEGLINRRLQGLLASDDNELKMDDAARIVGCWKALSKQGLTDDLEDDGNPMRRAVAFCQVIEAKAGAKTRKVGSKNIASMFQAVVEEYQRTAETDEERAATLTCQAEHIDGAMDASEKDAQLAWLRAEPPADSCRVLSNVRCLSEGVDVPALDAVLFLTPRNSQVDVVQSVGRVMRKAPGKTRGYIVLPVVIPAGKEPHEALGDNKTYKVVWQVLQALRSHDDRFDAMVNKLELIGKDPRRMEIVAVTEKVHKRAKAASKRKRNAGKARGGQAIGSPVTEPPPEQAELTLEIGEIERAIYAKLVRKVGNRHHWEDWANDIAAIANTHIDRIRAILENADNAREREAFEQFATELRDDLNDAITDAEIIEMLAQHMVTRPVFEALFEGYDFARANPISRTLQQVLDTLDPHRLDKEADTLQGFYESVKLRAEGIDNADGRQKIIVELYDKFFRNAFPRMTDRLGIVYTPVEVVDFILRSVDHILRTEFNVSLGRPNVHILDPFTGTGTFITRLMQLGLVSADELKDKYASEIHANEIVLLAYYIAAINIESTYHDIVGGDYLPFEGICLTDTFQMYESEDLVDELLVHNSERRKRQKALDIRVIVGNPPYSVGQGDANANNANLAYPSLDRRIRETYAARTAATNKNSLYDSYIRAIRWASDRVGDSGVIGFVTNAGWMDGNTADGMRKCLADEFSGLYVFHLRGNQRTAGELSRREGGKIFGSGSRAPIAISLLVKNPHASQRGQIHFHDIGDYLSREDKLRAVADFASIEGIDKTTGWRNITPDEHGDWLNQRDIRFDRFMAMGDKKGRGPALFDNYSNGVKTQRDAWCYNASKAELAGNMQTTIAFYNHEVARFDDAHNALDASARKAAVDEFIDADPTRISWTRALKQELAKDRTFAFDAECLVPSLYRPFNKQWLYFNRRFNEMVYQMPGLFPHKDAENRVIGFSAPSDRSGCFVSITDCVPSLHATDMVGSQYFPLYLYEAIDEPQAGDDDPQGDLLASKPDDEPREGAYTRRDAITDAGLAHFRAPYPDETITKEDLFYYVYGLLHSPDYRERYNNNLAKELPRIPRVTSAADFWAFSEAGRKLAELHLDYDTVPMYAGAKLLGPDGKSLDSRPHGNDDDAAFWRVEKMKHPKLTDPDTGKRVNDLTTVIYNARITVSGIPEAAYAYVVNGKPAVEWVIERQRVKTDKASGIVNDANDWATETMANPRYPLELLLRVITVSVDTMQIVNNLPALDILDN